MRSSEAQAAVLMKVEKHLSSKLTRLNDASETCSKLQGRVLGGMRHKFETCDSDTAAFPLGLLPFDIINHKYMILKLSELFRLV